ncbi:bifunctional helix-turn-helix transcriptional regulator/GNAT family N-acetyltransferase [Arenimonas fontis]|uniref:MarR family transcriptional regulator n=1 Tax=Arenimonas fontis TaxID=2608255 RepID=A0A5B2ZD71_9GAMM|nr:helix-turn-helix domain-containing GNAT family N-acetyltransferase [Arenimonas fontis]KAA2285967.1 MarR family transcriptional regulator [Arenimonas fontis]
MDENQVAQVRRFNRAVTQRIGVLNDDYLGRGRPLAQLRLIFEIGKDGRSLRELREGLGLDSGYLSRLLRALESEGLVETARAEGDARVRIARLTAKGKREYAVLDRKSHDFAASLLAPLSESRRLRLVQAMTEVENLLRASAVRIETADPDEPQARQCLDTYYAELSRRFETGFDPSRGAVTTSDDMRPPRGLLLLARLDGRAVGCGVVRKLSHGIAEIKRMWVAPELRGLGIAQHLLDRLEAEARAMGCRRLRLDTNGRLTEAMALYLRNGYREIPRYNDNPYAEHWFEKRLRS